MQVKYAKLTNIPGGVFSLFNILLDFLLNYVQYFNRNVEGLMRLRIPEERLIAHFTDP